jgi:hypothetical protein
MSNFFKYLRRLLVNDTIVNECLNNNILYNPPQPSILLFYLSCSRQFDMSYPYCYSGPKCQLEPFFVDLKMKCTPKFRGKHVRLVLSERVLAWWRRLVAFRKATNHLHRAMCTAIEMASKGGGGVFWIVVLFAVALVAAGAIWSK